jgi:hypothetical protein
LVALTGSSTSLRAHLVEEMFGGGGSVPRKELMAKATVVCL